jgi:MFS family permease
VFIASLGASTAFLGLVEGIADATASLLKLASGYVADHFSRRKPLVLAGYGIAALARPLVAIATAPWHVLAVRVTDRVGKGVRSAPRDVLIANSVSSKDVGRAFGFHRAMERGIPCVRRRPRTVARVGVVHHLWHLLWADRAGREGFGEGSRSK